MSQKALYWINDNWESLEVDNTEFLDNLDSTDFALAGHKHFKSEITDMPGNATTSQDGLMSAGDKTKLNSIAVNANNYIHPNDANTRHVTDALINKWNAYETTINNLKSSVSDGKTLVASAITAKGVSSSGSDTFQQMHDKILSIQTSTPAPTVTALYNYLYNHKYSNANVGNDAYYLILPYLTKRVTYTAPYDASRDAFVLTFNTEPNEVYYTPRRSEWNYPKSVAGNGNCLGVEGDIGSYTCTGVIGKSNSNGGQITIEIKRHYDNTETVFHTYVQSCV